MTILINIVIAMINIVVNVYKYIFFRMLNMQLTPIIIWENVEINIGFRSEIDPVRSLNKKMIKRLVKIINIFLIRFFNFCSPHYLIGISH